jgi:erythromycin esterase-like protein
MPDRIPLQTGWDMTEPGPALSSFLSTLPERPQLLGLGEPTHRAEAFLTWRNRIFRSLVLEHGFRSIALESDAIAGLRVDAHVASGEGTLDDALRLGFSHGFGELGGNRDLIEWMRAFNAGRDEADRLRFYGFDAPTENMWAASPRHALLELHAFLSARVADLPVDEPTIGRLCGEDDRWTDKAAAMDPARSVGGTQDAARLRLVADDLLVYLEVEAHHLNREADAFWHARLHARAAQGLLRYHALMARETDTPSRRVSRLMAQRDAMMADNLGMILEREAPRGPTLAFAHNLHLVRDAARMSFGSMSTGWLPVGARLAASLGRRYALIASTAGEGEGLTAPPPGTVEGWLAGMASSPRLFPTAGLLDGHTPPLETRADTAGRRGYFPLKPEDLHRTDGILFLPTEDAPEHR